MQKISIQFIYTLFLSFSAIALQAQLYFPPSNSTEWDTLPLSSLEWCDEHVENLYSFLQENNTKAFILLKDGKIVLEKYFDDHTVESNWYWASAGKTLTGFLVGLAQEQGYLDITAPTSSYLGQGWTSTTPAQEINITVQDQLSMTTGLDDNNEWECTDPSCLIYKAAPGSRWAYHNAPYTLLDEVITSATGRPLNVYYIEQLRSKIGMDGLFVKQGYNNIFVSSARSMARFGLLLLNKGDWDNQIIMNDKTYYAQMVNSSQNINPAYGFLTWLNGKSAYMIPQSQILFQGSMMPHAPIDLIAALGKNGQFINVVPSQGIVWIRMGNAPDNSLVSFTLNDDIWRYIQEVQCISNTHASTLSTQSITLYPNPSTTTLHIQGVNISLRMQKYRIFDLFGRCVDGGEWSSDAIDISSLPAGYFILQLEGQQEYHQIPFIKS